MIAASPVNGCFVLKTFSQSHRFSRFTVGLVGLAFCVFLWGLQYKLSLYDPPQAASHNIPTAKLLSKNEQGTKAKTALAAKSSVSEKEMRLALVFLALGFLIAVNLVYQPAAGRARNLSRPSRPQLDIFLTAFSFRPPPIPA